MRLEEHMMADKSDDDDQTDLLTKTKPKTKRPPLYKVLLLNDDFTPMEFVVDQGGAGDGFCPPPSASAAMHHGKRRIARD